jgi:hypothetical protein
MVAAALLCALLAGLPSSERFRDLHSQAATAPPPPPQVRKHQYRVVNFICTEHCPSDEAFVGLETNFVRDIIQELKFDSQNESRIARLPIGIYDAKQGCQPKDECDRITIDMDGRLLLLKCTAKQIAPVNAKRCDLPPKQRQLCVQSMLEAFAAAVKEHHMTVHGGN